MCFFLCQIHYTGSHFDRLKVGDRQEYDINIILYTPDQLTVRSGCKDLPNFMSFASKARCGGSGRSIWATVNERQILEGMPLLGREGGSCQPFLLNTTFGVVKPREVKVHKPRICMCTNFSVHNWKRLLIKLFSHAFITTKQTTGAV